MTKYLITSDLLTFVNKDGETVTLNKNNPYFLTIKSLLDKNQHWSNEISDALTTKRSKLLENTSSSFNTLNGKVYYKERLLSPTFGSIVAQYLDEGISLLPLGNLMEKVYEMDEENALETMELVASGTLPITFTGQLIGYKRQSWTNKGFENVSSYEQYRQKIFSSVHKPGDCIESNVGLTIGTLNWAGRFCPDQGALQEVIIEPKDIINIKSLDKDKPFLVKKYMFLGEIPEYHKNDNIGRVVFIMQTNTMDSNSIIVRKPYSPETIKEYFNTLISRSINNRPLNIGENIEVSFEGVSACL